MARVPLSIGIFFSLMVVGLTASVPRAMLGGLTSHHVPVQLATGLSHLPPTGYLFAAFLGYNPLQQLLGAKVLATLPHLDMVTLIGKKFFPALISAPFRHGLIYVLLFAAAMCLVAALASWLRGGKFVHEEARGHAALAGGGPGTGGGRASSRNARDDAPQPEAARARSHAHRHRRTDDRGTDAPAGPVIRPAWEPRPERTDAHDTTDHAQTGPRSANGFCDAGSSHMFVRPAADGGPHAHARRTRPLAHSCDRPDARRRRGRRRRPRRSPQPCRRGPRPGDPDCDQLGRAVAVSGDTELAGAQHFQDTTDVLGVGLVNQESIYRASRILIGARTVDATRWPDPSEGAQAKELPVADAES